MWKPMAVVVGLAALAGGVAAAEDAPVVVELKDGSRLVGTILAEDAEQLRVRTRSGLEVAVSRDEVLSLRPGGERAAVGDANATRLLFSPTARPLRKGEGYFSDIELFFPGVAVGLTDHLSIAGGMSVVPGLGLDEQVLYVAPKLGFQVAPRTALAVGGLYAHVPGDDDYESDSDAFGLVYGLATFGDRDKSLSLGAGVAATKVGDGADPLPIAMIGGAVTLSPRIALVSENWLLFDEQFDLGEQPLGLAVRFMGDRLSADVGVVTVPAELDDGGIFPWVSVSFRFGGAQRARAAAAPATKPLAQAHWKLKPPMRPSTSHSSPQT